MSSHDVVNHVRRALGEKRVGHAGTLDPLASGVLVVGVGQGTRLMGLLTADTKSYVARIAFGTQTATDDAEGEVVLSAEPPADVLSREFAAGVVSGLEGEQDQVPPSFSAISVGGVRAYDRARKGQEVELKSRRVSILSAVLLDVVADGPDGQPCWDCAFTVSKGTYVRSIARDLGVSLGSAAHLVELRRTASGAPALRTASRWTSWSAAARRRSRSARSTPWQSWGFPSTSSRLRSLRTCAVAGASRVRTRTRALLRAAARASRLATPWWAFGSARAIGFAAR
jgi:tRNA pseudouridine(55) synthase